MAVTATTPIELVEQVYDRLAERVAIGRERLGRPLTLAEKILVNHLRDPQSQELERGRSYADFDPDRVAMQDATAQMALLQFMTAGLPEVAVPSTVHCDHLIQAKVERQHRPRSSRSTPTPRSTTSCASVSAKYGIGFWKPGSGIIHQVVLENYAFPGGMMIGTDSHTPNAGGLGMVAIGVGGADAVDVMTGFPFNVRWPKLIGVHLTGALSGWSAPKDVILKVAEILTVKGGTGAIVEYFGPGADSITATGKATICNMGAEIGATTSLFAYDDNMAALPQGHRPRGDRRRRQRGGRATCAPTPRCEPTRPTSSTRSSRSTSSTLAPLINGPAHPRPRPPGRRGRRRGRAPNGWPLEISSALVGSCTNSSYEDITRAASIARQAVGQGPARPRPSCSITPGLRAGARHHRARRPARRPRGHRRHRARQRLRPVHRPVGPHRRRRRRRSTRSSTATTATSRSATTATPTRWRSSRRPTRSSPCALAGTLDFDPLTDTLTNDAGEEVRLEPPVGEELPGAGLRPRRVGLPRAARRRRRRRGRRCRPTSDRLQLLEPFPAWDGNDYVDLPVLLKAKGKCTTDHISAAGPWLKYRGHLENISGNLFLGVDQRLHRRGRRRARTRSTARPSRSPTSPSTSTRPAWLGGRRRRELRRGLVPRARRHGAAVPQRQGDPRPQLRPHPRDQPQEAGRPAAHVRRPGRPTTRSARTTASGPRPGRPRARRAGARAAITKPDGTTDRLRGARTR